MSGIGLPEFLIVALVILIFVGPERLPEVARWCGRMVARGRSMIRDVQRELQRNAELKEMHRTGVSLRKEISGVVEDFGKVSKEVVDELSRFGDDKYDEDSEQENLAAKMNGPVENPEDQFLEEVEILRRSRKMNRVPPTQGNPREESGSPPLSGSVEVDEDA